MTAFHHYELICDTEGCEESFNAAETRVDVTRQKAATVGWVHVFTPGGFGKGRTKMCADYCQKHAPTVNGT